MAKLLPRCLDSLLTGDVMDFLDIIIVNDGSTDESSQVAHAYQNRHPEIVQVIDKPNGNYGSTINAALPLAKGKYVRIIDSDDCVDSSLMNSYVTSLQTTDSDVFFTNVVEIRPNRTEVVRYNTMGKETYEYEHRYSLDDILGDKNIRFFLMPCLTYRCELLRRINYKQTEGISYSDTEWATYPMYFAKDIVFLNLNLYHYFLDRDGQTMDPAVIAKSTKQMEIITDHQLEYYQNADLSSLSIGRQQFLKQYHENRIRLIFKLYLLDLPQENFDSQYFEKVWEKYNKICDSCSFNVKLYPENKLLRIEYLSYWKKHHKRWPVFLEKINHLLDVLVKKMYVIMFRR